MTTSVALSVAEASENLRQLNVEFSRSAEAPVTGYISFELAVKLVQEMSCQIWRAIKNWKLLLVAVAGNHLSTVHRRVVSLTVRLSILTGDWGDLL